MSVVSLYEKRMVMRFKWLFWLILGLLPIRLLAKNTPPCHRKSDACYYGDAQGIEAFVIMVPDSRRSDLSCMHDRALREGVMQFYFWYVQNRAAIENGLSHHLQTTDLFLPFNVSYRDLADYFHFIQHRYPQWVQQAKQCITRCDPAALRKAGSRGVSKVTADALFHSEFADNLRAGH